MAGQNWEAWRGMVLLEIKRQNKHLNELEERDRKTAIEVGQLKQIAAMCGAVSAAAMAVVLKIMFGG